MPGKISPEAADRLQRAFQSQTGGENSNKVKLLEEGLSYKEGRSPNRESQFDESRDRQAKDIARFFGVPGHKVGIIGNQPRANVEQENISFVTDTIRPLLVTWEQALNQRLLTRAERKEYYIEFQIAGLLRGDLKTRYEAYTMARQWGWLNVNEIRSLENMNSIGAQGDVYLQPLNMDSAASKTSEPKSENE
jgi:HK97 family phage portal protein